MLKEKYLKRLLEKEVEQAHLQVLKLFANIKDISKMEMLSSKVMEERIKFTVRIGQVINYFFFFFFIVIL